VHKLLDTVALLHDMPCSGLRTGDVGAIVELHEPDGCTVEFVAASGRTQALVTVQATDIRPLGDEDLLAVRRVEKTAA
jgi:hypothetical protein